MMYEGLGQFVRLVNPSIDGSNVDEHLLYDHRSSVLTMQVSDDNRLLVSGAEDGAVRVWNLNAQLTQRIRIPASVSRLRLSPDQNSLLIGSFDVSSAFIYDLNEGSIKHRLEGKFPIAWVIEYSPDGNYAAVAFINFYQNDVDTTLTLWDVETGEILREFNGHKIRVSDFSFSPDGRYLLSGSQNFAEQGELLLWDVKTGELVREFNNTDAIANVAITSDGKLAMTTSFFKRYMAVWDIESGTMLRRRDFEANIEFSRLGATSQTALIGLDNGRLLEVDMATLALLRSFVGHTGTIWDIAISHDGSLMVSGQSDGLAIIWDYKTGREVGRIVHPGGNLTNVMFGPNDRSIFTSAYQGNIIEWSISNQSLDDLLGWVAENRYLRDLTCEERDMYQIEPICESS